MCGCEQGTKKKCKGIRKIQMYKFHHNIAHNKIATFQMNGSNIVFAHAHALMS